MLPLSLCFILTTLIITIDCQQFRAQSSGASNNQKAQNNQNQQSAQPQQLLSLEQQQQLLQQLNQLQQQQRQQQQQQQQPQQQQQQPQQQQQQPQQQGNGQQFSYSQQQPQQQFFDPNQQQPPQQQFFDPNQQSQQGLSQQQFFQPQPQQFIPPVQQFAPQSQPAPQQSQQQQSQQQPASTAPQISWGKCPQLEPSDNEKMTKASVITKCLETTPLPANITRDTVELHREQIASCALQSEGWFTAGGGYDFNKAENEIKNKKLSKQIEDQVLNYHKQCKVEAEEKFPLTKSNVIGQIQLYQACMDYFISDVCGIEVNEPEAPQFTGSQF